MYVCNKEDNALFSLAEERLFCLYSRVHSFRLIFQVTCVILARVCTVDIVACFMVTPSVTVLRFTKEISVKVCRNYVFFHPHRLY